MFKPFIKISAYFLIAFAVLWILVPPIHLVVLFAWLVALVLFIVRNTDFSTNTWKTKEPARPKTYQDYLWLNDSEEQANRFFKAFKDELQDNDDYHMTKKEILEDYDVGDKIYKYEPFSLPYKVEDGKVYSYIEDEEWICVGSLKKRDMAKLEQSIKTELCLMPNYYKKVYSDEIETDQGDSYFGLSVILPFE